MRNQVLLLTFVAVILSLSPLKAQKKNKNNSTTAPTSTDDAPKHPLTNPATYTGLKLRNIGPAFASGRIADIAIHPDNDNVWYVAVGSGGVWKTKNAGNTWQPIFDDQAVYSTGCVTIDASNPSTVWVGSGENVGGRHVGFGDGVYKSTDEGQSWKNMGLNHSEHISKIIIHPDNSNIIWVAAQGPLWNKGGDRGLYKSEDGGATWIKTLGDDEWTGVTDVILDPRDPMTMYAATWQRHRTVAAYMGGGPLSGIHKSHDGGTTWTRLSMGLPTGNMGKIGLAISPQQPDILYAAIETDRVQGGVYKSTNRGASWSKQSDAVSGATGPHYYQELYACPHVFDRLYLMDVRIQVSDDGGKTFRRLQEDDKHSDNHALAFRADDPDYLLVGTDAGIYESFDLAQNWRFFDNLPITQYYKVAVNDKKPFYHVFGGTQDNGSHGGPSRTDNEHGIRNGDWYKTLGADGHQTVTDPANPDIIYAEFQQGVSHRVDLKTGDKVLIQPQPREGEDYERFNWDAPILVSPHIPAHLFVASHRVWKSTDRGDSWQPISPDLTQDEERITMPIMGAVQSWDAPWDLKAMSDYNTITSLAESPLQQGIIYAGTDDGIIQVTEDGGSNWRKIEVGSIPGLPATAFINDIKADLHDVNTVYVAMDNHKYGDFKPYFIKSTDRGQTWKLLTSNLPQKGMVWRMIQDHEDQDLMFLATEFGLYFTQDRGSQWTQLKGNVPTISFRDLTIHRGESDLIAASFGRGFFILDDYSPLRKIDDALINQEASLFPVKDALWYVPRSIASPQGTGEYKAPNPDFGATFTYYVQEGFTSLKDQRIKTEKEALKNKTSISFPGWQAIETEAKEKAPKLLFTITDSEGTIVRSLTAPLKKGVNRINWDLRKNPTSGIRLNGSNGGWRNVGVMVSPGTYKVSMARVVDGVMTPLGDTQTFQVTSLREATLPRIPMAITEDFKKQIETMQGQVSAFNHMMDHTGKKITAMQKAAMLSPTSDPKLYKELHTLHTELEQLEMSINGSSAKEEIGERNKPSFQSRMYTSYRGLSTSYGPTQTHRDALTLAQKEFETAKISLKQITDKIPSIEKRLQSMGAPWIEGQDIPE